MSILDRRDVGRPYLIAHRGASARCPENTVLAFRRAVEEGAEIVETDVRMTADGEFVLIHDATVDRTTDGSGRVDAMSLAELRERSIRGTTADGLPLRIPTLEEMVAAVPPPVVLALELKDPAFRRTDNCRALAGALRRMGVLERTLILSSSRRHLAAWRSGEPDIPVGLVSWGAPWPPRGVELLGPPWPVLAINRWYVRIAGRRGQLVCPLDPSPDRRLEWYVRSGCDAVLSDDPGTTGPLLRDAARRLRRSAS